MKVPAMLMFCPCNKMHFTNGIGPWSKCKCGRNLWNVLNNNAIRNGGW